LFLLLILFLNFLVVVGFVVVALVGHSSLLDEFDHVLEGLGELVFLFYTLLQEFEVSKQLF